jgi:hypothetical protein
LEKDATLHIANALNKNNPIPTRPIQKKINSVHRKTCHLAFDLLISILPTRKITQFAMKIPSRILTGAALFAAVLSPSFAQTATTKPVGYRTETVKTGVFNLLSSNLDNPVGAAGTIDTIAATVLTDNEANFSAAFVNGEAITLKITDGANAGITQDVTAFTATTLTTAQDISSLIATGVKYEVRKTPTVSSTFGATNSAGLLEGGAATADIVWIPDGAGGYTRVFRSNGGLQGIGWRRVGGGPADAATLPIAITDAIFIQRRGGTDLPVVFTGHVQTTATKTGVITGFNPTSRIIPVGLSLTDSALQTELTQGSSATADLLWNPNGAGGYDRYFWSTGGLQGVGWRSVGGGSTDRGAVALASGFLVQRRGTATNVTLRIPTGLDL